MNQHDQYSPDPFHDDNDDGDLFVVGDFDNQHNMAFTPMNDFISFRNSPQPADYPNVGVYPDDIKYERMCDWEEQSSSLSQRSDASMDLHVVTSPAREKRRVVSTSTTSSASRSTESSRHKNKVAASKSRAKKKIEQDQLQEHCRVLRTQHTVLVELADVLRSEVLDLKNEILSHSSCNFPLIQRYIVASAERMNASEEG